MRPDDPPDDVAALLAWAARSREAAAAARAAAAALRDRVDHRGLSGPAGDALALAGEGVAGQVVAVAGHAEAAAQALVDEARGALARRATGVTRHQP